MSRQKSNLDLYLQKAAAGDEKYIERLCKQIADRLLIVPIAPGDGAKRSGSNKEEVIKVYRVQEAHRVSVPVFTSKDRFENWCKKVGHPGNSFSLLGADLCLSLGAKCWLDLDSAHESAIQLQPFLVERIAQSESFVEGPPLKAGEGNPIVPPDAACAKSSREKSYGVEERMQKSGAELINSPKEDLPSSSSEPARERKKSSKLGSFLKFKGNKQ